MTYLTRSIEPVLLQAAKEFPVVTLMGPRQSGKTTLLKHLFKDYRYVSLDPLDVRASAKNDPRGFLEHYAPPVTFDEIQNVPELLPYIKVAVDAHRKKKGQFLLTGSQNLQLADTVNESLAGRTAILKMLPLTYREMYHHPQSGLPWQKDHSTEGNKISLNHLWETFLRGGYPEIVIEKNRDISLWHASYIQTYLERDVRLLRQIGDLTQFQIFLRMLAARSAQLLNITGIARDLGVAVNTIKAWLSILEATYQIIILRPYYTNLGKRLVKTPKVYFTDVGTLCYLVGLNDVEHARLGPMSGAIMETAVVNEIYRTLIHQGHGPQMYFWRTAHGEEIDILVKEGQTIIPLEVKTSATLNTGMTASIERLRQDTKEDMAKGYIVYPGHEKTPLGKNIIALPFSWL